MKPTFWMVMVTLVLTACSAPTTPQPLETRPADGPLGNKYLTLEADFDGDGHLDQAYFTQGSGTYLVWIKRDSVDTPVEVTTIPASTIGKFGLDTFPAGDYEGPCNKDIPVECEDPASITFNVPYTALALFEYELGVTMIFWNGERFITAAPYE